MNIIHTWANMINESIADNPDQDKQDKFDMEADKYEQEMKDKEEIEKEMAKKQIKENEDAPKYSPIKEITIQELRDDGYCLATIIREDGSKQEEEFEIDDADIQKMLAKLYAKVHNENETPTNMDAAAAIIYLQIEKNADEKKAIKWYFGKKRRQLTDWKFFDDLDGSMIDGIDDRGFRGIYGDNEYESPDISDVDSDNVYQ